MGLMEEAPASTATSRASGRPLPGRIVAAACWVVLAGLVLLVGARDVRVDGYVATLAISYTGWLLLPVYPIAIFGLATRRWALGGVAMALAVAHLVVLGPLVGAETIADEAATAPQLRVVTANVSYENDDPEALIDELADLDADVLMLQEVTPAFWRIVNASGLRGEYPHRLVRAGAGASGVALLSRFDLADPDIVWVGRTAGLRAQVTVRGRDVTLLMAHPHSPFDAFGVHDEAMSDLNGIVDDLPRPLVVAGDLNATRFNRRFDALVNGDLRCSHDARGRGYATTWPNGQRALPPILIDHVLVSDEIEVLEVGEGNGAGSDHRPVIADLAILS